MKTSTSGWSRSVVSIALAFAAAGALPSLAQDAAATPAVQETPEQREARMHWWREARFGMFIHWGIYSVPAGSWNGKPVGGIGEWIMNRGKIPVADYAKFAEQFNPTKFDAERWVLLAKEAGMKYIVITSKHHDGFAMFASKASPYNIVDATPYKHDPLKDLADACKKHGMKLGFYYSQAQDWHHPGGAASGGHWDKQAQDGDMDAYLDKIAVPQVKEILSNYGPVAVLWWDTPTDMTRARAEKLLPLLKLQPGIVVNNRLGGGVAGDTETPEQFVPATGYPGRDWETCMTMNNTWGYKADDQNWKTTQVLLRNLIDIASKGGNYLLNVGPTSQGLIPQPSVERLQEVGKWMAVNGDAIYATSASPFRRLPWGRCTTKPGKLYLHVFDWPSDGILNVPMAGKVTGATLLAKPGQALEVENGADNVRIHVPATALDPIATVVVLEVSGDIKPLISPIAQAAGGSFQLKTGDADLSSTGIKGGGRGDITSWTEGGVASWPIQVDRPGQFTVTFEYSLDPKSNGNEFSLTVADQTLTGKLAATKSAKDFAKIKVGTLDIKQAGKLTLAIKPAGTPVGMLMNLRTITLTPVKP